MKTIFFLLMKFTLLLVQEVQARDRWMLLIYSNLHYQEDLSRCIGSTTYSEYRNYFEKDRALSRRFQKIDVDEPSRDDSIKILKGLKVHYEDFHNINYHEECFEVAVDLSLKYISDRKLPDKAIDVIDEAAAVVKIKNKKENIVKKNDIESVVAKMVKIPEKTITVSDKIKYKNLERDLKTLIFGQDKAVSSLSSTIRLSKNRT